MQFVTPLVNQDDFGWFVGLAWQVIEKYGT